MSLETRVAQQIDMEAAEEAEATAATSLRGEGPASREEIGGVYPREKRARVRAHPPHTLPMTSTTQFISGEGSQPTNKSSWRPFPPAAATGQLYDPVTPGFGLPSALGDFPRGGNTNTSRGLTAAPSACVDSPLGGSADTSGGFTAANPSASSRSTSLLDSVTKKIDLKILKILSKKHPEVMRELAMAKLQENIAVDPSFVFNMMTIVGFDGVRQPLNPPSQSMPRPDHVPSFPEDGGRYGGMHNRLPSRECVVPAPAGGTTQEGALRAENGASLPLNAAPGGTNDSEAWNRTSNVLYSFDQSDTQTNDFFGENNLPASGEISPELKLQQSLAVGSPSESVSDTAAAFVADNNFCSNWD